MRPESSFPWIVQIIVAGVTLQLAVQYLAVWRRRRANGPALAMAAWCFTLSGALFANSWLFKADVTQVESAMFVRTLLLFGATLLMIPTAAAFARVRIPRLGLGTLAAIGATRSALWVSTDLIYTHRLGPDGAPIYGPLVGLLTACYMLLLIALLVVVVRRWRDPVERNWFACGVSVGIVIVAASFTTHDAWLAELLSGYWILPCVVSVQVITARRLVEADVAARQHAEDDGTHRAELSRTSSELVRRLWNIAAEVEASGVLKLKTVTPDVSRLPKMRSLSSRQLDIVNRLLQGERVPQIANQLFISQSTVRNHLTQVFERFGVHSQADLIAQLRGDAVAETGDSSSREADSQAHAPS